MVTDRYTKGVLTVIAVTLIYIGAMVSGRPLSAQSNATVMTAGIDMTGFMRSPWTW